jgi:hypothetical protein
LRNQCDRKSEDFCVPASRPDNYEQLPPLAAEDYTCDVCALVYPEITIDDAVGVIVGLPGAVRAVVSAIPPAACLAKDGDWDRIATRLPGEDRTARWLVRQAMHEGIHHLGDIRRIGGISG